MYLNLKKIFQILNCRMIKNCKQLHDTTWLVEASLKHQSLNLLDKDR